MARIPIARSWSGSQIPPQGRHAGGALDGSTGTQPDRPLPIVTDLTARGVTIEFVTERLTFAPGNDNPMNTLLLHLLGAVAQFERSILLGRVREGVALAKARGAYKGRKHALSSEQADQLRQRIAAGEPKARLAREFKISRETLYRYWRGESVSAAA